MGTGTPAPSPSYRHVLVPLDGSDLAAGALPTARALASRFGADVHTVSIAASPAHVAELAGQCASLLGADRTDSRVHVHLGGDPATGIREQAARLGSCLVCMSTHGRGGMSDLRMGSVARSVLAATGEPIVAVGPACATLGNTAGCRPLDAGELVACVDGEAASERVLPIAAAWADRLGMRLTILTVAEPSPPPLRDGATWHRHHGPQTDADAYLRRVSDDWAGGAVSVQTDVAYDPISASEGIRDYLGTHTVALVAVTTHGRSGLSGLMVGSGAASITRVSTAPVLVVPLC